MDELFTPISSCSSNILVKSSKFISFIKPISSLNEAEEIRKELQREYHDADHICYALRVMVKEKLIEKYSDAKEPHNSAGKPILSAMVERKIVNAILLVVRYFGGTKLGINGLVKAYKAASIDVIEKTQLEPFVISESLEIEFPFGFYNILRYNLKKFNAKIMSEEHRENSLLIDIEVPKSKKSTFEEFLKESKEKWKENLRWKWK